jgi:hypothetical protein
MDRRTVARLSRLALLAGAAGCSSPEWPGDTGLFAVQVQDDTFRVRITTPDVVAEAMDRLENAAGEALVIGELARGDGGFNAPWTWHMIPETVRIVDAAIELCDGTPSMVEANLDYWIDTVGSFCPWGARIVRRLE